MAVWRNFKDLDKNEYKVFRICRGCNKRFQVSHKLRLYCDSCRVIRERDK